MKRVDFLFSNDGHHAAMFAPVAAELSQRPGLSVRAVSLCEFRGIETPTRVFPPTVEVHRLLWYRFRKSSSGLPSGGRKRSLVRRIVRRLSWLGTLRAPIRRWIATEPDLVILPNDAAFPYGNIAGLLRRRGIPFVLVQEGIRFPLPSQEGDEYGRNGASAIAAWGSASANFFRRRGSRNGSVQVTGSPRHDVIAEGDWTNEAARIRGELGLGSRTLLLLTNPIDDQGFCTSEDKLALVRRFLESTAGMFDDPEFAIVVKLHGRESEEAYQRVCEGFDFSDRIHLLKAVDLYPLLEQACASVVFASTVGLEALAFGCSLGVLEIPGFGFVHDYVQRGAAVGLAWDDELPSRIELLLHADEERSERARQYTEDNLFQVGTAARRVCDLILDQLHVRESVTR